MVAKLLVLVVRAEAVAAHFLKPLGHFARDSGGALSAKGPRHVS
jgi:hypothetical protein